VWPTRSVQKKDEHTCVNSGDGSRWVLQVYVGATKGDGLVSNVGVLGGVNCKVKLSALPYPRCSRSQPMGK
jgi:hypothetical protein